MLEKKKGKLESRPGKIVIPSDLKKALVKNRIAWRNFCGFSPGYKKHYIMWIGDAKKEETRKKRMRKSWDLLRRM